MGDISAAMVMKLRKMSGQGMMDCKKALGEADGDVTEAMAILRKKGLATLAKRAGRATSQGIVISAVSEDGKETALVSLCCETDFVAKSDDFIATAETLGYYALACSADQGAEAVSETAIDDKKFSQCLTELVSKIGEKTEVGDYAKFKLDGSGTVNTYVHFNKKIGAMLHIETSDDSVAASEILAQAASDVAMHITATNPLALNKDEISDEIIEQEKEVYAEQVQGKPANILEKIIEGKLNKFFAEKCLLSQPFVKDDSKTVEQVITEAGKQAGGEATLKRFVRFSVD